MHYGDDGSPALKQWATNFHSFFDRLEKGGIYHEHSYSYSRRSRSFGSCSTVGHCLSQKAEGCLVAFRSR
jgi:hypothetical protein